MTQLPKSATAAGKAGPAAKPAPVRQPNSTKGGKITLFDGVGKLRVTLATTGFSSGVSSKDGKPLPVTTPRGKKAKKVPPPPRGAKGIFKAVGAMKAKWGNPKKSAIKRASKTTHLSSELLRTKPKGEKVIPALALRVLATASAIGLTTDFVWPRVTSRNRRIGLLMKTTSQILSDLHSTATKVGTSSRQGLLGSLLPSTSPGVSRRATLYGATLEWSPSRPQEGRRDTLVPRARAQRPDPGGTPGGSHE